MTIIKRIKCVNNIGVFSNFSWPTELDDFQAYNLIYGLNGSGKTTLSNILRCLELRKCEKGKFTVTLEHVDISSESLSTHATIPQVKVFNRDFVKENVFTRDETCSPIFFLGEDNVAKRHQIEKLEAEIADQKFKLANFQEKVSQFKKSLDEIRVDTAGTIKELLRSAGTGNKYNTYDKRNFTAKCDAHKLAGTRFRMLSDSEKTEKLTVIAATPKSRVPEIELSISDLGMLRANVEKVLSRGVVSVVIDALKCNPELNSWVGDGLTLHKELDAKVCLFCNGLLSKNRIQTLEAHFSEGYAEVAKAVSDVTEEIATYADAIGKISLPDEARLHETLVTQYRTTVSVIEEARCTIEGFLRNCFDAVKKKEANPFEIVVLSADTPGNLNLTDLNKQLYIHNELTANFQEEITAARESLEESIIADKFDRVIELEREISDADLEAEKLKSRISYLQYEVQKLDSEIKEHRRPAEQINADLASYLGRKDISLAVEDAGYRIMRDGEPATNLSEGEKTALAIIYFLKSLEDREFDKTKGIVVIDDPVSSLDANALYYAFSFIQDRTKDVGQLFIMTHNFGFLRLVRKWLFRVNKTKKKTKQEARMYMLNCLGFSSGRRTELATLDKLLSEYESEYSYLFSQILKGAKEVPGEIEKFYHYPNIARRVLEAFLAFRLPNSAHTWENNSFKSDMHVYLHEVGFDKAKTIRILNFLNAHSHNARPDDSVDHDESILLETPRVLLDVLALMEHADSNHCTEMKKLINSPTNP
jgi:wobble nucleotide-excising tRNase